MQRVNLAEKNQRKLSCPNAKLNVILNGVCICFSVGLDWIELNWIWLVVDAYNFAIVVAPVLQNER